MCHQNTGMCYDRPISKKDIADIFEFYQKLPGKKVPLKFVKDVFKAITNNNSPQPIVLVTLVDLFYRKINGLKGSYPWVSLPFSALDFRSEERLMSPEMGPFHGVFAMFSLAQRNLKRLRKKLKKHGVDFITFHDCGCFMPDRDDGDIMKTKIYKKVNLVRSHYEALGGAVQVVNFGQLEWLAPFIDMGPEQESAYQRMTECLLILNPDAKPFHDEASIAEVKESLLPGSTLPEKDPSPAFMKAFAEIVMPKILKIV